MTTPSATRPAGLAVARAPVAGASWWRCGPRWALRSSASDASARREPRSTRPLPALRLERSEPSLVLALTYSCRLAAAGDDLGRARAEAEEAAALAARHGSSPVAAGHSYIHAEVLLAAGDPHRATGAALAVLVRDVVNAADGWPVAEAAVGPPSVVVADE